MANFVLIKYLYKINTFLHFVNFTSFSIGFINYKYFPDSKKKNFSLLSVKNFPIILIDSFPNKNLNNMYFLFPSIISKILIIASYYKIYGYAFFNKNPILNPPKVGSEFEINEEKLTEKERVELELIDDKATKIVKIYEIQNKQKFLEEKELKKKDKIYSFLKDNEVLHENLTNLSISATLFTSTFFYLKT